MTQPVFDQETFEVSQNFIAIGLVSVIGKGQVYHRQEMSRLCARLLTNQYYLRTNGNTILN